MTQMIDTHGSSTPLEPCVVLRQKLLDEKRLCQADLAQALGISKPRLNMILKGRCSISPEIALRVERVFGTAPQFWLGLCAEFELFKERQRIGQELARLTQLSIAPIDAANTTPNSSGALGLPQARIATE